ncbi:hypothetical protein [Mycolicibacterium conceptionense]|uniref:hypothetical protein n=1 Tax=Mycolicibacterium conceptionense TaxID=451644 RepID=UPI0002F7AFAD|nr:hypothetical protein [Mycolicibacterium conceptionense]
MPEPTVTEERLIASRLGELTPTERVLGRLAAGSKPFLRPILHPVGRHSAAVWLDSGDYQGRHRAAEVTAA